MGSGGKAACVAVGAGAVDCGTASARCICCTAFAHCIGSLHCLAESLTLHRRTLHWLDASVTAFARCQCSQLGSLRRARCIGACLHILCARQSMHSAHAALVPAVVVFTGPEGVESNIWETE